MCFAHGDFVESGGVVERGSKHTQTCESCMHAHHFEIRKYSSGMRRLQCSHGTPANRGHEFSESTNLRFDKFRKQKKLTVTQRVFTCSEVRRNPGETSLLPSGMALNSTSNLKWFRQEKQAPTLSPAGLCESEHTFR